MAKMRKMGVRKMQQPGSYRAPSMSGYNRPRIGRVGKQMPAIKQFTPMGVKRRKRR